MVYETKNNTSNMHTEVKKEKEAQLCGKPLACIKEHLHTLHPMFD